LLLGCTTIKPIDPLQPTVLHEDFSHALLDSVLGRFVDAEGRVDYISLKANSADLEAYYAQVAAYSPQSHPGLFPDEASRLAYWLNAYNAAALKLVLTYYPIKGVAEVKAPTLLFFMPEKSGFFYFQRPLFGGKKISLYDLEHKVVRHRFQDARIHFALNCASLGCPRLPQRAFSAADLEAELDRETRRFMDEARNLRVATDERVVYLSALFDWYEKDFIEWSRLNESGQQATLLNYIEPYLSPEKAAALRRADQYEVRFNAYDWGLNDQAAAK
jgi:hypothetical protein